MPFAAQPKNWVPHEYQLNAMKFMVQRGVAGLFLDPGLGKTSITLGAFSALKRKGIATRMLVIAPLRVCYLVWPNEVKKWAEFHGLTVQVLHGNEKAKKLRTPADIQVINPEGLEWLLQDAHKPFINMDILTVDESTKFKHGNTKRFKLLRKWLTQFRRRYILTGTPTPNGMMDLFGQIFILDEGAALGKYVTHFRSRFFYQTGFGGYTWKLVPGGDQMILDRIEHFVLRLQDKDYLTLPELVYNRIDVTLPPEAREHYRQLEDEFITTISEQEVTALHAASASIKLRQLANGGVYAEDERLIVHNAKVEALTELVETTNGAPLLVFYQFQHDLDRIRAALGDVPHIGGGVSTTRADELCQAFNLGNLPMLLAHPASVGHGLNLQGHANHVVFFGLTYDLEHHDQAIRRVYRQGNPNTHVFVHYIVAENTIDEVVLKAIQSKDRLQTSLLNAIKERYIRSTTTAEGV